LNIFPNDFKVEFYLNGLKPLQWSIIIKILLLNLTKIIYKSDVSVLILGMAKVDLEIVKRILKRADIENDVLSEIIGELQSAIQEENVSDEPKTTPQKKQFVVLVADNEGDLSGKELMGWILQLPEDEPMISVPDKIARVAKAFNLSKKGRRYPVSTIGETCENVSSRVFKEQKLWLKTKEPILIVPVQNQLELDKIELKDVNDNLSDEDIF